MSDRSAPAQGCASPTATGPAYPIGPLTPAAANPFALWDSTFAPSVPYVFSNGNHTMVGGAGSGVHTYARSTKGATAGKRYVEITILSVAGVLPITGLVTVGQGSSLGIGDSTGGSGFSWGVWGAIANKYFNGVTAAYGSAYAANDVLMMATDLDAGLAWWGKNGAWSSGGDPANGTAAAFTGINTVAAGNPVWIGASLSTATTITLNAGDSSFLFTVPSGFAGWQ